MPEQQDLLSSSSLSEATTQCAWLDGKTDVISGRYRLVQRLRRGGMSEVFLAFDEQAQQHVAIKLVNDPDCIKRLQREVRIVRNLSHKHILPLLDDGAFGDYHYLVMPYMAGGNLRERLMQGKLTQEEAGHILDQLASALQCAHQQGILHRDIKPSNILLAESDEHCIYLADFGLAKGLGESSDITLTGCLIGTPEYMAPELADMPESVSSDIYALGILLYQMLTGRLPFTGPNPLAVYWKHIQEYPPLPSTLNPAISCAIEQVVLRAIDKDPQRRFTNASSMAQAYADALNVPAQSRAYAAMQTLPPVSITLYQVKRATPAKPYRVGAPALDGTKSNRVGARVYPPWLAPALNGTTLPPALNGTTLPPALDGARLDGRNKEPLPVKPASSGVSRLSHTRRTMQKGLLTVAALVLLSVPVSLGYLLSKEGSQVNTGLGANAALVVKAVPPVHTTPVHTTHTNAALPAQSPAQVTNTAPQNGGSSADVPKHVPDKHHQHGHGGGGGGDGDWSGQD